MSTKKLVALLVAVAIAFTLTACARSADHDDLVARLDAYPFPSSFRLVKETLDEQANGWADPVDLVRREYDPGKPAMAAYDELLESLEGAGVDVTDREIRRLGRHSAYPVASGPTFEA